MARQGENGAGNTISVFPAVGVMALRGNCQHDFGAGPAGGYFGPAAEWVQGCKVSNVLGWLLVFGAEEELRRSVVFCPGRTNDFRLWWEVVENRMLARVIRGEGFDPSRKGPLMAENFRYVRRFAEIGMDDVALVGGKNASLGEMYRELSGQGVVVPNGFAIVADAYRDVLDKADAWKALHDTLDDLDADNMDDLARRGARAREIVYGAPLPDDLRAEILAGYRALQEEYGSDVSLAVRSSATAEDSPTASFAGQQDTYLNIKGEERLLDACRRCFASLFTDRSIHYRIDKGFSLVSVALSIVVQKMVRSDISTSGIMFSLDTETGFRDVVPHQRRLWAGGEHRAGRPRSRRVLCVQAHL